MIKIQLKLYGNLLKNLSLYELYEKLDKKSNNPKKPPACNACESELKVTSAAKTDLVNLCHGVCNIMLNLGDSDIPCGKSCLGLCNNIKIWIYEHLLKITTKETEVNRFYESLKTIMKGDETKREICNLKLNMNNDNFKNFKFFYDFLYISKEIMDNISYKNDAEVKLYCTHIKEFVRYYNTIKGSCTDSECEYHNMLEKFKDIFTREVQLDDIYKNCNYEKTTCPSGSMEEEIPCLQEKEIKPTFSMQFDHKNNVISIISNIAIFIIPIFGLLSIFYKFTPLGFWLRSRMRKKNNTHKNMSEGKYDILENTSRTEQFYTESKEYNLKYQ
ncbi:PIR protein [Plasmodium vivax]|uniref:VIR protein n=1 Tax=Plasmodium vivax TaxID=5855 RepID=A0A565A6Q7_PLAVI|nr:PIR protein [Plasmodium vivax]